MNRFLIILLLALTMFSCKKSSNTLIFTLDLKVNNEVFETGKIYQDYDGRNIQFNDFKLYISDLEVSDESNTFFKDVLIFAAEKNILSYAFLSPILKSKKTVSGNLGLDTLYNNKNPVLFADSHPLSISQNMYWSMLKYRFLVIEGRIDTSATKDKTPTFPFSYHIGSDTMLRSFSFNTTNDELSIPIEILDIFKGIDILTHFDNHSESPQQIEKGIIMMDNLQCIFNSCSEK